MHKTWCVHPSAPNQMGCACARCKTAVGCSSVRGRSDSREAVCGPSKIWSKCCEFQRVAALVQLYQIVPPRRAWPGDRTWLEVGFLQVVCHCRGWGECNSVWCRRFQMKMKSLRPGCEHCSHHYSDLVSSEEPGTAMSRERIQPPRLRTVFWWN